MRIGVGHHGLRPMYRIRVLARLCDSCAFCPRELEYVPPAGQRDRDKSGSNVLFCEQTSSLWTTSTPSRALTRAAVSPTSATPTCPSLPLVLCPTPTTCPGRRSHSASPSMKKFTKRSQPRTHALISTRLPSRAPCCGTSWAVSQTRTYLWQDKLLTCLGSPWIFRVHTSRRFGYVSKIPQAYCSTRLT